MEYEPIIRICYIVHTTNIKFIIVFINVIVQVLSKVQIVNKFNLDILALKLGFGDMECYWQSSCR